MKRDVRKEEPREERAPTERDRLIQSLYVEFVELQDKTQKLELFMASYKFQTIDEMQRQLMEQQFAGMRIYKDSLRDRLINLQDKRYSEQMNSECAN